MLFCTTGIVNLSSLFQRMLLVGPPAQKLLTFEAAELTLPAPRPLFTVGSVLVCQQSNSTMMSAIETQSLSLPCYKNVPMLGLILASSWPRLNFQLRQDECPNEYRYLGGSSHILEVLHLFDPLRSCPFHVQSKVVPVQLPVSEQSSQTSSFFQDAAHRSLSPFLCCICMLCRWGSEV